MKNFKAILVSAIVFALILCAGCGKAPDNSASGSSANGHSETAEESSELHSSKSSDTASKSSDTASQSSERQSSDAQQSSSPTGTGNQGGASPEAYEQRLSAYLDGATVNDANFVSYFKSLGKYDNSEKAVDNAIIASPNANGGDGTLQSPCDLQTAFDEAKAGQTVYLRGGTYSAPSADGYFVVTKGNANAYITIRPYPGESVIITNKSSGTELYGFQLEASYTVIEGIEFADVAAYNAYGMVSWGNANHVIIKDCKIHDIKTTASNPEKETESSGNAILLMGESSTAISNVAIIDNECYNNTTGWAETLSVSSNCEYVYVLENVVHDNTNIGIDFYGNAGYCSNQSLDQPRYCVAAGNKISKIFCPYADCAGLYVDGARDVILQFNEIFGCQYGIEIGSEEKNEKYPVKNVIVRNNVCYDNSVTGIRVGGYEQNATGVVQSTQILNNTFENNGWAQMIFAKVDGITIKNNLIRSDEYTVAFASDFNENYTKNLEFVNNLIFVSGLTADELEFQMLGTTILGTAAFDTKFGGKTLYAQFSLNADKSLPDGSPAIDAGTEVNAGNFDFALNPRIKGAKIDVGAFEHA